jgi:hypothetical protein
MPLTTRQREALRVWTVTVQLPRGLPNTPQYFAQTLRQLVLQPPVRHLRHHLSFIAEKRAALGTGQP